MLTLFSFQIEQDQDSRKISLETLLTKLGDDKVASVFDVWNAANPRQLQHIIILKDGSFICTCLLLVNSGVVCRHFFHLMTVEKECKYHVSLIPTRWYKEELQNATTSEPFVFANTINQQLEAEDITEEPKLDTYMVDVQSLFPSMAFASRPAPSELSRMQKYGELNGLYK